MSVAQQKQQLPQQEVGREQGLDLESGEAGLNKQMKQKCLISSGHWHCQIAVMFDISFQMSTITLLLHTRQVYLPSLHLVRGWTTGT